MPAGGGQGIENAELGEDSIRAFKWQSKLTNCTLEGDGESTAVCYSNQLAGCTRVTNLPDRVGGVVVLHLVTCQIWWH